jgi:hypothetical protein
MGNDLASVTSAASVKQHPNDLPDLPRLDQPSGEAAATEQLPTLKLLTPDQWEEVYPLFAKSFPGAPLPQSQMGLALVLEEAGEPKAVMFFKPEFHMEPFCAENGYGTWFRTMVLEFERLLLERVGPLYYVCTAPNNPEQLAREESLGRVPMTSHIPVIRRLE